MREGRLHLRGVSMVLDGLHCLEHQSKQLLAHAKGLVTSLTVNRQLVVVKACKLDGCVSVVLPAVEAQELNLK